MSGPKKKKVIGVGSPIVDLLAHVDGAFVAGISGAKGGMELVTPGEMNDLLGKLGNKVERAAGGSAGNTVFALAQLGLPGAMLGMLSQDEEGAYYTAAFQQLGGDVTRFKSTPNAPTARCLSLVTPDSERTMRTDLGAAAHLSAAHVTPADFAGYDHAHLEGYLMLNRPLFETILKTAKQAGCTISLDLGSFEVVNASKEFLADALRDYVDQVFANEDEARAFAGHDNAEAALHLLGELCDVAAVKLGPKGAFVKRSGEHKFIDALLVENAIDSTGAGDMWAAGFLYGHLHGLELDVCARVGAVLGAEVVQQLGAKLNDAAWERVHAAVKSHTPDSNC